MVQAESRVRSKRKYVVRRMECNLPLLVHKLTVAYVFKTICLLLRTPNVHLLQPSTYVRSKIREQPTVGVLAGVGGWGWGGVGGGGGC